jgi:hypothetical protein
MEKYLHSEIATRNRLYKKYNRGATTIDVACATIAFVTLGTGFVGAALMATGFGIIPGIAMECVSGVSGLLNLGGVFCSRLCKQKADKHNDITIVAKSKLNSIHSLVSKALEDSSINDLEFKLIMSEIEKYNDLKSEIRSKQVNTNELIQQAKNKLVSTINRATIK